MLGINKLFSLFHEYKINLFIVCTWFKQRENVCSLFHLPCISWNVLHTFRIYQTIWNILQPIAAVVIFQIYYREWHKIFSTYSYNFSIHCVVSHSLNSRTMDQFFFFSSFKNCILYIVRYIFTMCAINYMKHITHIWKRYDFF